jgi:hypothetical protein
MRLKIQALGLAMVLFGSPIIHFFRDFKSIIPDHPAVMPLFSLVFFGMMLSKSHFTNLYKPNKALSGTAWTFLGVSFYYLLFGTGNEQIFKESFNFIFLLLFFYILCGVNRDIAKVIIPIIILVTLVDNFALIVSFILNPFARLGQRAVISNAKWGEGAGNPSLNSYMAFTGIIASCIWFNRGKLFWKLTALLSIFTGFITIALTMVRSTFFTLALCFIVYLIFNKRKIFRKNPKAWYEKTYNKYNIYLFGLMALVGLLFFFVFFEKFSGTISYVYDTIATTLGRAINTVLGTTNTKNDIVDPSAANRIITVSVALEGIFTDPWIFFFGKGYKALYVDVPILEVWYDTGLVGLIPYLMFLYFLWKNLIKVGFISNNPWLQFWVYYSILLAMNLIARGQPFDPYFWNYFLVMVRFVKADDLMLPFSNLKTTA